MYQIKTTPSFDKDIKKLNSQIAERIIEKLDFLAENPDFLNKSVKYLPKDLEGLRKYRVGNWRILFWVNHNAQEITLYGIDSRDRVYKKLKR